jgi:hypothetical protein
VGSLRTDRGAVLRAPDQSVRPWGHHSEGGRAQTPAGGQRPEHVRQYSGDDARPDAGRLPGRGRGIRVDVRGRRRDLHGGALGALQAARPGSGTRRDRTGPRSESGHRRLRVRAAIARDLDDVRAGRVRDGLPVPAGTVPRNGDHGGRGQRGRGRPALRNDDIGGLPGDASLGSCRCGHPPGRGTDLDVRGVDDRDALVGSLDRLDRGGDDAGDPPRRGAGWPPAWWGSWSPAPPTPWAASTARRFSKQRHRTRCAAGQWAGPGLALVYGAVACAASVGALSAKFPQLRAYHAPVPPETSAIDTLQTPQARTETAEIPRVPPPPAQRPDED